jgi:hypothetical protein
MIETTEIPRPDLSRMQGTKAVDAIPESDRPEFWAGIDRYLAIEIGSKRPTKVVEINGRLHTLVLIDGWWYWAESRRRGFRCPCLPAPSFDLP